MEGSIKQILALVASICTLCYGLEQFVNTKYKKVATIEGVSVALFTARSKLQCADSCSANRLCIAYQYGKDPPNNCRIIGSQDLTANTFVSSAQETVFKKDLDLCVLDPCQNGATCKNSDDSYACFCSAGFTGRDCETEVIDACSSVPCMNNGTCRVEQDSFTCECAEGFDGILCEIECPQSRNWTAPDGWNKTLPNFHMDFEDDTCVKLGNGAELGSGWVSKGLNLEGDEEDPFYDKKFAHLGDISSVTCLVDPETCSSGATLAAWVKVMNCPGGIMTSRSGAASRGFNIYSYLGKIRYYFGMTNKTYQADAPKPSGWFHVTVVYHRTEFPTIYYNATEQSVSTRLQPGKEDSAPGFLFIGAKYEFYSYCYVNVDELLIWDEELDRNDVTMLYNLYMV